MINKIIFNNVCVDIPIYNQDSYSLRKLILGKSSRIITKKILHNINFEIKAGERVGIYGNNGSGKTTLLRTIVGGYFPTSGTLEIVGSLSSMIDIGLGLDAEASGIDNIKLKLGLINSTLRNDLKIIEEIIDFSGLKDSIQYPLRTYSSGMAMRLAFSIATSVQTDILVLDEWLSVGDAEFAVKSEEKMNQIVNNSSIIILASHNSALLENFCTRLIKLNNGEIVSDNLIK